MKAFPTVTTNNEGNEVHCGGMDLRDYFAAKAMQAIITRFPHDQGGWKEDYVAESAYFMADAMMEARNNND